MKPTSDFLNWRAWGVRLGLLTLMSHLEAAEVRVFAAASLTDALKEIAAVYQQQTGDKIVFNFAASSFLARQIEEGAPADIFFSADETRMNALEQEDLIEKTTRKSRLSNSLVIVVPLQGGFDIKSAVELTQPRVKRIALADPRTVPAGMYARGYLEQSNLWSALQPKVVPTDNVRAALAAVESGNVEAGMVYRTDAAMSKKVKVVCEIPRDASPAISYSMAMLRGTKNTEAARLFLDYLGSLEAGRVFEKFGFVVRP